MTQSLRERLHYHPDPRTQAESHRKVDARIRFIQTRVDLRGKTVLDLGCSGGSFSFAFAQQAKRVVAIDGDREVIERNREIQRDLGLQNIEFIHASIDAGVVNDVGHVDVTLLLSVYHHMLTVSDAYDWNIGYTHQAADAIIDAVNRNTRVFCFEIGYPNEGYEWCERLPSYGEDWDEYIRNKIFKDAYSSIDVGSPNGDVGLIARQVISRLSIPYRRDTAVVQRLKSLFRFDARDLRKIFIGWK